MTTARDGCDHTWIAPACPDLTDAASEYLLALLDETARRGCPMCGRAAAWTLIVHFKPGARLIDTAATRRFLRAAARHCARESEQRVTAVLLTGLAPIEQITAATILEALGPELLGTPWRGPLPSERNRSREGGAS